MLIQTCMDDYKSVPLGYSKSVLALISNISLETLCLFWGHVLRR